MLLARFQALFEPGVGEGLGSSPSFDGQSGLEDSWVELPQEVQGLQEERIRLFSGKGRGCKRIVCKQG